MLYVTVTSREPWEDQNLSTFYHMLNVLLGTTGALVNAISFLTVSQITVLINVSIMTV